MSDSILLVIFRCPRHSAAAEVLLAVAAVVFAFALVTPEGSWSSPWRYAGGAATVSVMITFRSRRLLPRRLQLNNGAIVWPYLSTAKERRALSGSA